MNSFYNPTDFLMKHFFSCNFMLVAILIVFTLSTMNILILKYDIGEKIEHVWSKLGLRW